MEDFPDFLNDNVNCDMDLRVHKNREKANNRKCNLVLKRYFLMKLTLTLTIET